MRGRVAILSALLAAVPLSGCVAAAIPVIAAGTMAKTQRDGERPAATDREPARSGSDDYTVLATAELPAPGPNEREAAAARQTWDAFYGQALAAAEQDPVAQPRMSALLASPGSLTPDRMECGIQPPAVALDLDPAGALFAPADGATASPRLVQALAALRSRGVAVAWISANFPDAAPAIRRALRTSGLDPESRDDLVLLRYPDDTKQGRRRSIAETRCLVAIAGDERADFDELFAYLKDPTMPTPLESLIGDVWFLTPQPLD